MDKQVDNIHGTAKELQTTSKFILKRLHQVLDNPELLDCKCESSSLLQDSLFEIEELKGRVSKLELKEKEKEEKLVAAVEELKLLHNNLEQLELTVQTDDVKLKHSSDTSVQGVTNVQDVTNEQSDNFKLDSEQVKPAGLSTNTPITETVDDDFKLGNNGTEGAVGDGGLEGADRSVGIQGADAGRGMKRGVSDDNSANGEMKGAVGGIDVTKTKGTSNHNRMSADKKTRSEENVVMTKSSPEVVNQVARLSHYGMIQWQVQAQIELNEGKVGLKQLGGIHTVFLIDISASMIPAWNQVKQFFNDFISGLEDTALKLPMIEEHVAVVTFGHETKVQLRLTNDFAAIRETFGKLKLGGPSPLSGGLTMAMAAAGSSNAQGAVVNHLNQGTKLVLITDGEPTESGVYAGPDVMDPAELDETRSNVVDTLQKIEDFGSIEMYVVPVGNANTEFLQFATSLLNGKMLDYKQGRQFSRRLYLMITTDTVSLLTGAPHSTVGEPLSDADLSDLMEIKSKSMLKDEKSREDLYYEETNLDLPKPGSRVRRGPDWIYDNQDSSGPGTVVGHTNKGAGCMVQWDGNGEINLYRYGKGGHYHILLVDEPRQLQPGETIAVGCIVKPGSLWNPSNTNVTQSDTGVVLRLAFDSGDCPKALVRWDNGTRGDYMYDVENCPEIQVCGTALHEASSLMKPGVSVPQSSICRPVKNKNKNI